MENKNKLPFYRNNIKRVVLLFAFLSLVFTTSAQTKEETITWLTEKLSKNAYCGTAKITIVTINECEMIFSSIDEPTKWSQGKVYRITVPTSITSLGNFGQLQYSFDAAKIYNGITQSTYKQRSTDSYLYIQEGEENLKNRIEKALKHLSTFCKKKEEVF